MKNLIRKSIFVFIILSFSSLLTLAQNSNVNYLVGSWNTSIFQDGVTHYINWNILANGQEIYYFTANFQTLKKTGYWTYKNGIIYESDQFGNLTAYGRVDFVTKDKLKVTVIDNGYPAQVGQVRYYTREKSSQIPFTGSLNCKKCSCRSWGGGSNYNSPCPNPGCGHSYADHRRAGE